ncbi:50S ribosomal protein L21 [Sulfurimonas paralvinellae]|uniref:Large ribosomal subunit protein bL21 n=1 Tax=Sulfurimonas paralvinellae TaxID=317658 RepID=A0A7M1B9B8_9BACT|nr:50S ribosomal protein L21 [Sulfurimonas paralvinellae]QOP45332.1 50S ribosomal protein L21 [Sulfurimonas paralvinellae]
MYAIIKNGGKQYKVQEGDVLSLDKLSLDPEATIEIKEVLAVNAGELKMGAPYVDGAVVTAEVISEGRDKKVTIFKKRRRKDSKVKRGFRRDHTRVRITKIAA